jgi:RNA polymerase sigma-70 factor (ECF subfamily)
MTKAGVPAMRNVAGGTPAGNGGRETVAAADLPFADGRVATMYSDHGPFLLAYITRLLKDRYLAEDVVQETMLRAWRHSSQISPEKSPARSWLVKVAYNIAVDKIRMCRSRPAEVAHSAAAEPSTDDHADAVVTAIDVRDALRRLGPAHRVVIEQLYFNGLTAREAAAVLGIPEGTVCSRAYYGLRALRRQFGVTPGTPQGQAA